MTSEKRLIDFKDEVNRRRDAAPLPSGGGGDNYDGMEARVAKLESDVANLVGNVGEIRTDIREMRTSLSDTRERLGRLETKVDHLPGKGFMFTVAAGTLTFMVALMTIFTALAPKLQAWIGVH